MKRLKKLDSARSRVSRFATHVELFSHRGRKLRRVYKDGKLGLMSDSTYELELPIEFHEINWVFGGTYLTVAEPGSTPVKYEEGKEF